MLLIDTDPGIDDALALCLALRAPGATVVAVTTVAGNVPVAVATRNVARVLGVTRPVPPPVVAVGSAGPRARPLVTASHVHGEDGLGGLGECAGLDGRLRFPEAPLVSHPGDAADLIVRSARQWGGELTIVALGPLTNLAEAVDRDAAALRRVRDVVVMGGAIAVGGNVTAAAEFNVFVDPESAARVLEAELPLTLVPLDVTRQVVWRADAIARLAASPDPVARFAVAVAERGLALAQRFGEAGVTMHDPLAVGVALDPALVETVPLPVGVETEGRLTRGMTVADRRGPSPSRALRPNCRVALRVDATRFLTMLEEVLWQPRSA